MKPSPAQHPPALTLCPEPESREARLDRELRRFCEMLVDIVYFQEPKADARQLDRKAGT